MGPLCLIHKPIHLTKIVSVCAYQVPTINSSPHMHTIRKGKIKRGFQYLMICIFASGILTVLQMPIRCFLLSRKCPLMRKVSLKHFALQVWELVLVICFLLYVSLRKGNFLTHRKPFAEWNQRWMEHDKMYSCLTIRGLQIFIIIVYHWYLITISF